MIVCSLTAIATLFSGLFVSLETCLVAMKRHKELVAILTFFVVVKSFILFRSPVYFDEGIYLAMSEWFLSGGSAGFFEFLRPLALPVFLIP